MRKTLVFFLVLALVCGCGAVLAARAVSAPRADVTFREEIVSGDPAAAAGLEADYDVRMKDHLIWDSTLRFSGENYTYDTAFRYVPRGEETAPQPTYNGVIIDLIRDAWTSGSDMDVNPYGYGAAFRQLLDETEPGSTGRTVIRVADYYEEYPLRFTIDLPDITFSDMDDADKEAHYPEQMARTCRALREFFRIPTLPDEYLELDVDKNVDGTCSSRGLSSVEKGDAFWLNAESVLTEDGCYFWFSNRTQNGRTVDTSRIPGGYGVYLLPLVESQWSVWAKGMLPDPDGLRMFYPVDPAAEILHAGLSKDETRLLLYTREDGKYVLRVIVLSSGELLQELTIGTCGAEDEWLNIFELPDFICLRQSDSRLYVLTECEDGQYQIALQCPLTGAEDLWFDTSDANTMVFDGTRLAIAGPNTRYAAYDGGTVYKQLSDGAEVTLYPNEDLYSYDSCGLYLLVFDASGLTYRGVYYSSLEDTLEDPRNRSYSQTILPNELQLSWH